MSRSRRRTRQPAAERPEQHYLVEPRALAGGGDLRHVFEFLAADGWPLTRRPNGLTVAWSPDGSVRIGYDPHGSPAGWTISGKAARKGEEPWVVTFGQATPVEIVAAFTDALTLPRTAHAPNVWAPLERAGWKVGPENDWYTARSPDRTAWLQYHQGPHGALWWAAARSEEGFGWMATLTPSTPMHLVQAFAAGLSDPRPVMRPRGSLPPIRDLQTTSVSVLPSQLSAAHEARVHSARAAAWARATGSGPPGTTPATRPAARHTAIRR
ncbi:DUF317 domain-containing protein [Streptomyces sp. UH6]|uniref:DUF317 domain-containing protein n=1 Tax=Streptomyces sp. UH6 TaxID=2748379 RepID=UPI0015D499C0|nr:DUF317 domain-containing protein [Streptomyces sp. UH6]NYV73260.1 DUF317 domain-containing protein [Streptomyces sp. UH6]